MQYTMRILHKNEVQENDEVKWYRFPLKIFLSGLGVICIAIIAFTLLGYYEASKPKSYLPDLKATGIDQNKSGIYKFRVVNPWYIALIDPDGNLRIETSDGEGILAGLIYFSSCEGSNDKWGLDNVSVGSDCDSIITITGNVSKNAMVSIQLTVPHNLPSLDVSIKTFYKSNTIVKREALGAEMKVPE